MAYAGKTKEERKEQVLSVLEYHGVGLTHTQLMQQIGLTRSPYSNDIMNELVEDGYLFTTWAKLTNGLDVKVYHLTIDDEREEGQGAY